jgi:hypothetical protein
MDDSFVAYAREFLSKNPSLVDALVNILYDVADDLDSIKGNSMLSNGEYISPYKMRDEMANMVLMKLGYRLHDLPDLCRQGRGKEILQEVDKMQSPTIVPSRRALPSNRD